MKAAIQPIVINWSALDRIEARLIEAKAKLITIENENNRHVEVLENVAFMTKNNLGKAMCSRWF